MPWVPGELPQSLFVLWWPKGAPTDSREQRSQVGCCDPGTAVRSCCPLSRACADSGDFSAACFAFSARVMSTRHRAASDGREHPAGRAGGTAPCCLKSGLPARCAITVARSGDIAYLFHFCAEMGTRWLLHRASTPRLAHFILSEQQLSVIFSITLNHFHFLCFP